MCRICQKISYRSTLKIYFILYRELDQLMKHMTLLCLTFSKDCIQIFLYVGKVLSQKYFTQEFHDALFLCDAQSPLSSSHCDGCGEQFSVHHGLASSHDGLACLPCLSQ